MLLKLFKLLGGHGLFYRLAGSPWSVFLTATLGASRLGRSITILTALLRRLLFLARVVIFLLIDETGARHFGRRRLFQQKLSYLHFVHSAVEVSQLRHVHEYLLAVLGAICGSIELLEFFFIQLQELLLVLAAHIYLAFDGVFHFAHGRLSSSTVCIQVKLALIQVLFGDKEWCDGAARIKFIFTEYEHLLLTITSLEFEIDLALLLCSLGGQLPLPE